MRLVRNAALLSALSSVGSSVLKAGANHRDCGGLAIVVGGGGHTMRAGLLLGWSCSNSYLNAAQSQDICGGHPPFRGQSPQEKPRRGVAQLRFQPASEQCIVKWVAQVSTATHVEGRRGQRRWNGTPHRASCE